MMAVRARYWSYDATKIPGLGCGDGVCRDGVILVPPAVNLVVGFPRLNAVLRKFSHGASVSSSARMAGQVPMDEAAGSSTCLGKEDARSHSDA